MRTCCWMVGRKPARVTRTVYKPGGRRSPRKIPWVFVSRPSEAAFSEASGATVEVVPEASLKAASLGLLTNTQGIFRGDRLPPGLYTVRVTLAGFLPTIQQHVRISAHLTTVVRLELESMFASLDQLRRQPSAVNVESDDWKWVLRSASITRPVLQWADDGSTTASN